MTAFQSFSQDTITGVVNRVAAPYFEQNVCDSRFAILSEGETYYVMVDNYWPNPYLEDLVIHYDTIPVGNEIEVVGEIKEMEDGNGEIFQTIDISKNLSSNHLQILGFFGYSNIAYPGPDLVSAASFSHYNGEDGYYITINGELQTEIPFSINGRTLIENKRYLFIGSNETLTNYNGNSYNVFELADALPYDVEDYSVNGILTKENDLCLSSPYDETHYLSLFDGEGYRYLTNKRKLQNNFINDAAFMEGDSVMVGGFEFIRYDLFGASFNTMEIVKLQSAEERTHIGLVNGWGMPYINLGIPVPGSFLAFINDCNGHYDGYYIMTPDGGYYSYGGYYIVNNDTIQVSDQQVAVTFMPRVEFDNWINPYYRIFINHVDFKEHIETLHCTLAIEENSLYFGTTIVVKTQDDDIYFIKPYIYTHTAPDHITIGNKTIYVGDEFLATGTISSWYDSNWGLHQVIDMISVDFESISESHAPEIHVSQNPTNGIIGITSEQLIESIIIFDNTGKMIYNRMGFSQNEIIIDLTNYKGLFLIHIVCQNGHKTFFREIIR